MKRLIYASLIAVSAGFIAAGTASAVDGPGTGAGVSIGDYAAGQYAGGIGASRHNLGAFGNPNNDSYFTTNGTTEVCVFCHTPHHTNSAAGAPLWNRGLTTTAFTAYGTTIGGNSPDANLGGATLACLSCHDGVTTFDNLANAPGKARATAGGSDQGWTFYKNNSVAQTAEPGNDEIGNTTTSRLNIGGTSFGASGLSNDHPVSITYDATKASLRPTSTTISTVNLTADLAGSASTAYGNNLAQNVWAVNGFLSNSAFISDLLRGGKVECTSCHDPHFKNLSWEEVESTWSVTNGASGDGMFLRRVGGNTGSGVCRTCHAK